MIDGDGCWDYLHGPNRSPRLEFAQKSDALAQELFSRLRKIGLRPTWRMRTQTITMKHPKKTYTWNARSNVIRCYVSPQRVAELKDRNFISEQEAIGYVAGFFQAEGSHLVKLYGRYLHHSLRMFNKDALKLERVQQIVSGFGIPLTLRECDSRPSILETQHRETIKEFVSVFGDKK